MYQSAAPTSFKLLYDEKRDKKETKYGSEILRVNDLFYFFFKFSYLPVNNCYHILGSLQRDSMPKLQIYNTSSGHKQVRVIENLDNRGPDNQCSTIL